MWGGLNKGPLLPALCLLPWSELLQPLLSSLCPEANQFSSSLYFPGVFEDVAPVS